MPKIETIVGRTSRLGKKRFDTKVVRIFTKTLWLFALMYDDETVARFTTAKQARAAQDIFHVGISIGYGLGRE